MDNQKLDHAIEVHDEIVILNDILNSAANRPYLDFVFTSPGGGRGGGGEQTFTIKDEPLVHRILMAIEDRKIDLEKVFQEL